MQLLIKGVEFEQLDTDKLLSFLSKTKKTQLVDAKCFYGKKHLIHSILQTLKAFREKSNIARTEEMEFLIRLSAEKQIKNALKKCRPAKRSIFVSWSEDRVKIFSKLKKEMKFKEFSPAEPSDCKQKDAIERTATFYLS